MSDEELFAAAEEFAEAVHGRDPAAMQAALAKYGAGTLAVLCADLWMNAEGIAGKAVAEAQGVRTAWQRTSFKLAEMTARRDGLRADMARAASRSTAKQERKTA